MKAAASITVSFAMIVVVTACATSDMVIGSDCDAGFCTDPPAPFATPEAGTVERTLTDYCPSDKCPTGYTTCSTSQFVCDVDFRSDPLNCGACGAACPAKTESEAFDCIEGRCVLRCLRGYEDCDGLVDNGCEVRLGSSDNCRACGDRCDDGFPCIKYPNEPLPRCGCQDGYTYCPGETLDQFTCANVDVSDKHCGACGNECDPNGPVGAPPLPPNAKYGCVGSRCGNLKCRDNFADCNADLGMPGSDGCETKLGTHANCSLCGDDCRANGMNCIQNLFPPSIVCGCAPGLSFCGVTTTEPFIGNCVDFASDLQNCGGCGRVCPGSSERSLPVCSSGTCKLDCFGRWADCNGNLDDNCEVDTFSDPQNCGGCGITCDVAAGQACAGGRCVVEPCDDGEEAR
ncbi:MAG: hypothetical protein BGO98_25725 [Myxococcales bacterium 68-20]|nr:hypothetical protein [Myxococcales bacterium]OJY16047.1 MAG: hypothetical protein BGO98_25725 [Myxococcales bacterium 68-20]